MNKKSIFTMSDEYPSITQKEIDNSTFRIGLQPTQKKCRISIMLDPTIIEWFKGKAGEKGYQTLINEALKKVTEQASLEEFIRKIVREELKTKP